MNPDDSFRAYVVEGIQDDHPSVIVFAQSDTHALMLAARDAALEHLSPALLQVMELPEIDHLAPERCRVLDWHNADDAAIYRDMGWEVPGQPHCRHCNRVELPIIPPSRLNAHGVCRECSEKVLSLVPGLTCPCQACDYSGTESEVCRNCRSSQMAS